MTTPSREEAWRQVDILKRALGIALEMVDDLLPQVPFDDPAMVAVITSNIAHGRALLRKFGPPDPNPQPESSST